MTHPDQASGYDTFYEQFDSSLMRQLRQEAYGQDIGQHSWITAEELAKDIPRLQLTRQSRLLDLGCGPGGPLTFVVSHVGCRATGVDLSPPAIESARARATSAGLSGLIDFQVADSNEPLRFQPASFNAVISVDVVLHLRDRAAVFNGVARILVPGGRFLFTDAGVITGLVSNEEVRQRAMHGFTQFVPAGFNERTIELAGFRLLESADRTPSLLANAMGRLASRNAYRKELEQVEGKTYFEAQLQYLETVIALSERGSVSRVSYLAESHVA
ncbi:MAG: class I SAM-dependent methyltransferase [Betaproteobacteria bacterium]